MMLQTPFPNLSIHLHLAPEQIYKRHLLSHKGETTIRMLLEKKMNLTKILPFAVAKYGQNAESLPPKLPA